MMWKSEEIIQEEGIRCAGNVEKTAESWSILQIMEMYIMAILHVPV